MKDIVQFSKIIVTTISFDWKRPWRVESVSS